MILGIDVDGVVAELDSTWFARYNTDYNDNLSHDNVTSWETHEFVKPECGYKIYEYLKDPTLYDDVKPIKDSLVYINKLKDINFRIVYITTTPIETPGVKFNWLVKYGFLSEKEKHNYFEATDKSLFRVNTLLDDRADTIKNFPGMGVIYDQPWNRYLDWKYRVYSWEDFFNKVTNHWSFLYKEN